MSTQQIQIDSEGDVLIIVPIKRSIAELEPSKSSKSPIEKRFVCSKKHLTFASHRAAKIFSSGFKEATKQDDGFHHWKFDETFDDKAFDLVLNIIHGKTRGVQQRLDPDMLVAVASVVDDLQCHDALNFYGRGWISSLPGLFSTTIPSEMNKTLVQYVFSSFVFEYERLFEDSTKAAIRFNNGAVPMFDLPIRANIPGHIEKRRLAILGNLGNALKSLENSLLEGKLGCNSGCTAMLLGALIQGMKAAGLYPPRVSPQFPFLTLDFVINSLRNAQSPTYFSAEKGSVAGKYSGSWTLSTRSITAPPTASPTPPVTSSLFGQPRPPPTASPTPPVTGGLFGGQPRPNPPTTSGRLFGSSSGNTTSSGPTAVDKEDDPIYLVRHSCSVKDLLKPLLDAAEAEIQGLKLADYSKS
ncbi:Ff.00g035300.m01.CDS01 [Fusarium sp. VM40]|nr:Ff.00g035300.m01.CDS01 [Fusarium sp. VM40]